GERIFHRPVDHAVDYEAVPRRIDVGNAAVVPLVVQAGRRDDAVAALHGRERSGLGRVGPAHLAFELRARAVTAVDAYHAARLLGGVGRNRILDGAGRRFRV